MSELTKLLRDEIAFIYDNYDEFVYYFLKSKEVMDLYQVSFSEERLHYVYCMYSGQHISDSILISEYKDWKINTLEFSNE